MLTYPNGLQREMKREQGNTDWRTAKTQVTLDLLAHSEVCAFFQTQTCACLELETMLYPLEQAIECAGVSRDVAHISLRDPHQSPNRFSGTTQQTLRDQCHSARLCRLPAADDRKVLRPQERIDDEATCKNRAASFKIAIVQGSFNAPA